MSAEHVDCPECDAANPDGAKFCHNCGSKLPVMCPECGTAALAGAKFCTSCGTALAKPSTVPSQKRAPRSTSDETVAERRLLTVVFCDLVGSTALSEEFDPEDYRDLITRYRGLVERSVAKFGGEIANYAGDGVVAIFGYPVAQERSHHSAALCGLEIASEARDLEFSNETAATNVRVGIHTGPVVVGTATSASMDEKVWLFGDTPNIAARIQALADVGDVLVSEVTRRLIGERLDFTSVGSPPLAGVSKPIEIFQVRPKLSGFEEAGAVSLQTSKPTIGRTAETALVRSRWDGALEGEGQVLLLSGDAGVGKSKIAFGLKEELANETSTQLVLFGSPLHRSSAFFPIKNALMTLVGILPNAEPDQSRAQLHVFLQNLGLGHDECAAHLLRLLGLEDSNTPDEPLAPEREKRALIDALLLLCTGLAEHRPLLVLLDDVHWFDASTMEFVNAWIDQVPNRRCLLLLPARSEFKSP
mgnify:CR=1 FL=1